MKFEITKEKFGFNDSERCIEIPWALSHYSGEQIVLDIGYAHAEERYLQALIGLKIPNLHGIDICRKAINGINSHVGDIRYTSFPDNFFDLIFCISTIEHIGRDNSIYSNDLSENSKKINDEKEGDIVAINEIYRITKNNGNVIITVPFGKYFDYGWFIHYDENRLNKLLNSSPFKIEEIDFFRYENGWKKCYINELTNILYKDNNAPAAAGLACLFLKKSEKIPLSIPNKMIIEFGDFMNNHTIEIRDDEINVEEIMQKIQDNIRRRQAAGKYPPDPDSIIGSSLTTCCVNETADVILRDIANVNTTWDMHNYNYSISSHRPVYGKLLVKGRQMVNEEVRRYIDPVISRQTNFNASIVRLLNNTKSKCTELDFKASHLDEELSRIFSQQEEQLSLKFSEQELQLSRMISNQEEHFSQKISEQELQLSRMISNQEEILSRNFSEQELQLSRMISNQEEILSRNFSEQELQLSRMISNQEEQLACRFSQQAAELNTNIREFIHSIFDDVFSQIDKDLANRLGLARILEERVLKGLAQTSTISESLPDQQTNYFLFEEHFRGSREDIKQRQIAFLPYFDKCTRVLDIGCGRGEFLEILKSHNIGGMGVDLDADMVAYCNTRQLEVEKGDAVIYLEKLDDKSLDGIFIDQVVEHLEPSYLIRLLFLCHQKLKFGCYMVVETVNPLSFLSFVNFYIDITHKRPIHPETLQYLMNIAGFRECKNIFFSPVSEDCKLKKITEISKQDEATLKNMQIYNHNIEILNTVLFGAQDYAVIGKK